MKNLLKNKLFIFLFFAAVFIIAAIFLNLYFDRSCKNYQAITAKVQQVLNGKEAEMQGLLDLAGQSYHDNDREAFFRNEAFQQLSARDFSLFVYKNDSLEYWSDSYVPATALYDSAVFDSAVVKLENGWYRVIQKRQGNLRFMGMILIKKEYRYENDYLNSDFSADFGIHGQHKIIKERGENEVFSSDGTYLFSIKYKKNILESDTHSGFLFLLYFIGFLFFIAAIFQFHRQSYIYYKSTWLFMWGFLMDVVLIRFLLFHFRIPRSVYASSLFSPLDFASSNLLPSFGDLLTNVVLLIIIAWVFYRYFRFAPGYYRNIGRYFACGITLLLVFVNGYLYTAAISLINSMVLDSVIPYTVDNIFNFTEYSLLGFIIIGALLLSLVLVTIRLLSILANLMLNSRERYLSAVLGLGGFLFLMLMHPEQNMVITLTYPVFLLGFWLVRERGGQRFDFSRLLLGLVFFSVITTYVLQQSNAFKEHEKRKSLAQKLSTSQDPIAEYLFANVEQQITGDQKLQELLRSYHNDESLVSDYILKKYFRGYWDKYQIQITLCDPNDSLFIKPAMVNQACTDYFDGMLRDFGRPTSTSALQMLNYGTGGNSYLSKLVFEPDSGKVVNMFIELYSKFIPKGLGYPELLIDKKIFLNTDLSNYSYARYRNGTLADAYGKYYYSIIQDPRDTIHGNLEFFNRNHYNHLYFRIDGSSSLIISKKEGNWLGLIAPFSLLFLFLAVFMLIFTLIVKFPLRKDTFRLNFKNRLQLSMVSIILISFILIGVSMYYYIRSLNENKNTDNLSEKAMSILIETQSKLADYDSITMDMEPYVSMWLVKFSNVFFTDINLYDLNGNLISSSRPQVFSEGLLSQKMNPVAFKALAFNKKTIYIHKEQIGSLEYYSAYLPFYNSKNRLTAYLNLPYFARENELKQELSLFMMTFINIYVFLIAVAIVIALIIAGRMTQPLKEIRMKIGRVRLGGKNEKIEWKRQDDEIGNLVVEYNRMIDELSLSAELLARSERESAWREMAKQVAHEIKNPLTPMKLSVQYLQRAWNDRTPDWEDKLMRFSKTLIDQIESLSAIATAFSDFAKMPRSEMERLCLIEIIQTAITTFSGESTVIDLKYDSSKEYAVLADKKQLIRVMVNLITNAIQAIDGAPEGRIAIGVSREEQRITVSVADNGPGIPEEQKSRIFVPNFSTKTEGMGLGLAMVKNIIEGHSGRIWFVSREGEGAIFYFELPAAE